MQSDFSLAISVFRHRGYYYPTQHFDLNTRAGAALHSDGVPTSFGVLRRLERFVCFKSNGLEDIGALRNLYPKEGSCIYIPSALVVMLGSAEELLQVWSVLDVYTHQLTAPRESNLSKMTHPDWPSCTGVASRGQISCRRYMSETYYSPAEDCYRSTTRDGSRRYRSAGDFSVHDDGIRQMTRAARFL